MQKQQKGLVDNHDGDIILNESGTSVSFGWDTKESDVNAEPTSPQTDDEHKTPDTSEETNNQFTSKL